MASPSLYLGALHRVILLSFDVVCNGLLQECLDLLLLEHICLHDTVCDRCNDKSIMRSAYPRSTTSMENALCLTSPYPSGVVMYVFSVMICFGGPDSTLAASSITTTPAMTPLAEPSHVTTQERASNLPMSEREVAQA